ncbi:hypothetical protein MKK55_11445 [Methylobacterium sp. J-059]|uniref:hypothetical protein n=1 Tax=Methylobacterium sp. J-059 TaxID=2836643 RepID=UPI001FBC0516|nr:hypothetical protein [Methylobacterium sp. J-059]MCJ2039550.1 hypothetical protein [Methylobacterium sp. J-059]
MSDQNPKVAVEGPPPPSYVNERIAVGLVAGYLRIETERAKALLLDALCDGALIAMGDCGGANFIQISPKNWIMVKYENAELHYNHIEINTHELFSWVSPAYKRDAERLAAQAKDAPQADVQADSGNTAEPAPAAIYRTGLAGHPTARNLWEPEAHRRFDAGEFETGIGRFSERLSEWVRVTHPGAPKCQPQTIGNSIRAIYNQRKKEAKRAP